jgi:hypothetical protein
MLFTVLLSRGVENSGCSCEGVRKSQQEKAGNCGKVEVTVAGRRKQTESVGGRCVTVLALCGCKVADLRLVIEELFGGL